MQDYRKNTTKRIKAEHTEAGRPETVTGAGSRPAGVLSTGEELPYTGSIPTAAKEYGDSHDRTILNNCKIITHSRKQPLSGLFNLLNCYK